MDSLDLLPLIPLDGTVRPRPGRVILELEDEPEKIGSLYVPENTRTQRTPLMRAKVVSVGYGPFYEKGERFPGVTPEDFKAGDMVLFRALQMEIGKRRILTDTRRVDAVVLPSH